VRACEGEGFYIESSCGLPVWGRSGGPVSRHPVGILLYLPLHPPADETREAITRLSGNTAIFSRAII